MPPTKTLRRQLFRSHLLVMFAAVGVMILLGLVLGLIFELVTGWPGSPGKGGDEESFGPFLLLGIISAALIAASFVSLRVTRRLAAPMERLGRATRRMASGDYDVTVERTGVDELDALGDDVQTLARTLAETEERRLRLIGDIAHELRTPLSTIEGSMEALMDGVVAADDETFAGIGREAARLRRLAGDLSALSSSAEQDPLTHGARLDLAGLARRVVELLQVQAEAKDLSLRIDAVGPIWVRGDEDRLVQVLTNVIGNAIQYTDEGRVDVTTAAGVDDATVTVADTGRGLTGEEVAQVFERFYRADDQYADGTGVGLTIARQLVWAHGGSLEASSAGTGRGSTFAVTLPRVP
ncbi:MAG: ATP-binding protein [Actinomycetota bacterium]